MVTYEYFQIKTESTIAIIAMHSSSDFLLNKLTMLIASLLTSPQVADVVPFPNFQLEYELVSVKPEVCAALRFFQVGGKVKAGEFHVICPPLI